MQKSFNLVAMLWKGNHPICIHWCLNTKVMCICTWAG